MQRLNHFIVKEQGIYPLFLSVKQECAEKRKNGVLIKTSLKRQSFTHGYSLLIFLSVKSHNRLTGEESLKKVPWFSVHILK